MIVVHCCFSDSIGSPPLSCTRRTPRMLPPPSSAALTTTSRSTLGAAVTLVRPFHATLRRQFGIDIPCIALDAAFALGGEDGHLTVSLDHLRHLSQDGDKVTFGTGNRLGDVALYLWENGASLCARASASWSACRRAAAGTLTTVRVLDRQARDGTRYLSVCWLWGARWPGRFRSTLPSMGSPRRPDYVA